MAIERRETVETTPEPTPVAPTPVTPAPVTPTPTAAATVPTTAKEKRAAGLAAAKEAGITMKWYKLLFYFCLIVSGLYNLSVCGRYLSGSIYAVYGLDPNYVYAFIPQLRIVDIAIGLASLGVAILTFYTWALLGRFSKKAFKFLCASIFAPPAVQLIYTLALLNVFRDFSEDVTEAPQALGTCVAAVIVILFNQAYFNNRKSLFVND